MQCRPSASGLARPPEACRLVWLWLVVQFLSRGCSSTERFFVQGFFLCAQVKKGFICQSPLIGLTKTKTSAFGTVRATMSCHHPGIHQTRDHETVPQSALRGTIMTQNVPKRRNMSAKYQNVHTWRAPSPSELGSRQC